MKKLNPGSKVSRVHRFNGLGNKKKLFEKLAELLTLESGPSFHRVLDGLNSRERLGSTCIGKGVAIPHCKLAIDSPKAAIMLLDQSVKYSDSNREQVDIIFGLLVPKDDCEQHLHLLSSIAKLCEQERWLDGLRVLSSEQDIAQYITDADSSLSKIL